MERTNTIQLQLLIYHLFTLINELCDSVKMVGCHESDEEHTYTSSDLVSTIVLQQAPP